MTTIRSIPIADIGDGGAQMRIEMDPSTVRDYADAMAAGETFPPVVVWNALGRGYSAILAQHYQHRIHYLQRTGKLFPLKGRNFRPVFGNSFP